jgi:hypothetical protein
LKKSGDSTKRKKSNVREFRHNKFRRDFYKMQNNVSDKFHTGIDILSSKEDVKWEKV